MDVLQGRAAGVIWFLVMVTAILERYPVIAKDRFGLSERFNVSKSDLLPIVCHGVPAQECAGVPPLGPDQRDSDVGRRKKRDLFDNEWRNGYPSSWNRYPPWATPSPVLGCPTQSNPSLSYNLSPVSAGYPAEPIAEALGSLPPEVLQCLLAQVVVESTPPALPVDPITVGARPTCPYTQLRLWKFQSLVNGECWVLQNFQENILYRTCDSRVCVDCASTLTTTSRPPVDSFWSWSRWGPRPTPPVPTYYRKLCLTDYTRISLWAYCPNQVSPLVRDRIIIPNFCTCQSVECVRL